MKVNLGSGRDYKKGWINVDAVSEGKVDVVADLSKKFPFTSDSVQEVLAQDILEHFTKKGGLFFLNECNRILIEGGKITLRVPNVKEIIKKYCHDPEVMIHFLYGDTSETGVFGAHKYGYTRKIVLSTLITCGFTDIDIKTDDTNYIIEAKKMSKKNKKSKLNILVIQQCPDIGGAEVYMNSLLDHISKNNNVTFATNSKKLLRLISKGIKKQHIPVTLDIDGNYKGFVKTFFRLPKAYYLYSKLLREFKKNNGDVILMSGFSEKLFVTGLTKFISIPIVWMEYGDLKNTFKKNFKVPKIFYRLVKDIPKALIVPTKHTLKSTTTDARISRTKTHIIPCGTEVRNISPRGRRSKKIVVGNVSRMTSEKGQKYLLKAAQKVVQKNKNIHFLFVGNGPGLEKYKEYSKELGIEKAVTFTGFVTNKEIYLKQMDIFIFPTVWEMEGFGLVVIEAMAHKIPVIASNIGPLPHIIDDAKNGILISPKNSDEIANEILNLSKDTEKRKKIGQAGYDKVKERYDIKNISKKVELILKQEAMLQQYEK